MQGNAQSRQYTVNHSLLSYLQTAVKLWVAEVSNTKKFLSDTNDNAVLLCDSIERILVHGLVKTRLMGSSTCEYWNYIEHIEKLAPNVAKMLSFDW